MAPESVPETNRTSDLALRRRPLYPLSYRDDGKDYTESPSLCQVPFVEYLDILDSDGKPTGQTGLKDAVKQAGHWHRVVNLWLLSPQKGILQMKRAAGLNYFPHYWGTIGGHVQAGEDSVSALLRETEEELGLSVPPAALELLFTDRAVYPWKDREIRVFRDVYAAHWNGELTDLVPDPREVEDLRWFSLEDLKNRYDTDNQDVFPLPETYQTRLWAGLTDFFRRNP